MTGGGEVLVGRVVTLEITIKKKLKYMCLNLSSSTYHSNFVIKYFLHLLPLIRNKDKNSCYIYLLVTVNI